ncbi:unnamed protein product, partial [Owenia fusiformis]
HFLTNYSDFSATSGWIATILVLKRNLLKRLYPTAEDDEHHPEEPKETITANIQTTEYRTDANPAGVDDKCYGASDKPDGYIVPDVTTQSESSDEGTFTAPKRKRHKKKRKNNKINSEEHKYESAKHIPDKEDLINKPNVNNTDSVENVNDADQGYPKCSTQTKSESTVIVHVNSEFEQKQLTKNQKRKLKKKRHKDRLRDVVSMPPVP